MSAFHAARWPLLTRPCPGRSGRDRRVVKNPSTPQAAGLAALAVLPQVNIQVTAELTGWPGAVTILGLASISAAAAIGQRSRKTPRNRRSRDPS